MLSLYTDNIMEVIELLGSFIGHSVYFPSPVQYSPDQQVVGVEPLVGMAQIWMHTQEILRSGLLAQINGSPPIPVTKGPLRFRMCKRRRVPCSNNRAL